ncbi:unnamed protein product [Adineta ricciae]|uniref:Uncharacterized protein n=1 Tax=Adineta ricciae TaxID=249248 RepID=A0A815KG42_ADIRI|nr:unnamed protein product [Adineta ricciae]
MNIAFIYHLNPNLNWTDLQTMFLEKNMFLAVMICYKVRTILYSNSNLNIQWIENGLYDNEPIAYELKRLLTGKNWQQLAEQSIKEDQSQLAMNYICLCLDTSFPQRKIVESVLKFAKNFLSSKEKLQCILTTYKKIKNDINCLIITIEFLVEYCQTNELTFNILARGIQSIQKSEYPSSLYIHLLNELSKYEEFFQIYDACLHHIAHMKNLQNLIKNHPNRVRTFVRQQLKSIIHEPILSLAKILININNVDVIEEILSEHFNERIIANACDEFRAKMWLITGIRDKLQNQYVNAVGSFHTAMICYPSNDTNIALCILLQDSDFISALLAELLLNLNDMNIDKLGGFACDIEPPPIILNNDNCLKPSNHLSFIRQYEQAILNQRSRFSIKNALSYIDMCDATHNSTIIISNLLLAGIYFYNILLQNRQSPALVYAYRQSIELLCNMTYNLAIHNLSPSMQHYACRIMISLLCRATSIFRVIVLQSSTNKNLIIQEKIISKQYAGLIYQLLNRTIHLTDIAPLMNIPVSLTFDTIYFETINESFMISYLDMMTKEQNSLIPYQYYILEGIWLGWIRNRIFSDVRYISMEILLKSKQWNMNDVQNLLQSSIIPRTSQGWLYCERRPLILTKDKICFQRADGISVDMTTGEVYFLFQPALNPNDGLFDEKDVAEVLQNDLSDTYFSLDQPDGDLLYHPFQEMKYKPKTLLNTRYLETMLHADYLLKMLTTGIEVCAKIPFITRSIDEGFFQRLPEHLRQKLRPLDEMRKDHKDKKHSTHRFWIQADDTTYEVKQVQNNSYQFSMRVGNVRLRVRKRRLIANNKGILIDDDDENLDEHDSSESQFARAFTENYDEIGKYFPELLRLKELVKLGVILDFIRDAYKRLARPISINSISSSLSDWHRRIEYPYATHAKVSIEYQHCLARNMINASDVSSAEEQRVKSKILRHLENRDQQLVGEYTDIICEECHSSDKYTARSYVKQWLESKANDSLTNFIADSMNNYNKRLLKPIEKMKIKLNNNEIVPSTEINATKFCHWVPAVFHTTNNISRVYGGLQLSINIHSGVVPLIPGVCRYNALTLLQNVPKKIIIPEVKHPSTKDSNKTSSLLKDTNSSTNNISNRMYPPKSSETHDNTTKLSEAKQTFEKTDSTSTSTEMPIDFTNFHLLETVKSLLRDYIPESLPEPSPLIQYLKEKYPGNILNQVDTIENTQSNVLIHTVQENSTIKNNTQVVQEVAPSTTLTTCERITRLRQSNDSRLRKYKEEWLEQRGITEQLNPLLIKQNIDDETEESNDKN